MPKITPRVMGLGARVRERREALVWSQSELARATGVTQANISRIEAGKRLNCTADVLAELARALGVSADWLLGLRSTPDHEQEREAAHVPRDVSRAAASPPPCDPPHAAYGAERDAHT